MNESTLPIQHPFVLSGGGARGYAHLGVLKAFSENNIFPSAISATSAGSIAAAFICDGYTTDEVRDIFQHTKVGLSMEWRNWRTGLLSLKTVEKILIQTLRHSTFEDLKLPLYIAATDFNSGSQVIFDKGPLIPAILAASSIPLLFHPVEIEGIPYVDGGLTGNLPAEPLLERYQDIIGVHVNPLTPYLPGNGYLSNIDRTLHMAIREPVLKNKLRCKWYIEPEGLTKYGMFDFKHFDEIYNIGLNYTRAQLKQK